MTRDAHVTIRPATRDDVPRLAEMGAVFYAHLPYADIFPEPQVAEFLEVVLKLGAGWVAAVPADTGPPRLVGMFGLVPYQHPILGGSCVEEAAWWVDPEWRTHGIGRQLLLQGEAWARARGAQIFVVSAPAGSPWGTALSRFGYQAIETKFVKRLAAADVREQTGA